MSSRKPWQKTLYGNEGYPDNYTDPTFLKDLQKNKNITAVTFSEAVRGASKLNNEISCVTAFLIIFHQMYMDIGSPDQILIYSTAITVCGYWMYVWKLNKFRAIGDDLKTVIGVLVFGYIFSPMLHTLTNSISTDTIFSTTFFVMFLHLVFFDYGLSDVVISKAISLNAAIFGSICLASRLATSFHAFTLLVVAMEFFVLLPIWMKTFWSLYWLAFLSLVCTYFLATISTTILVIYIFALIFINFICPYIFVYQQKYKNNIHGPWDEAIVKDLDLLTHLSKQK